MGRVATRECHHIPAALHVDLVAPLLEVVCRIVYRHGEPLLEPLANDEDIVMFTICEGGGFWVVLAVQDASKEVVLQISLGVRGPGNQQKHLEYIAGSG